METTRSSCGRRRPENASTPWKATGTFVGLCYCVGKTVKVTVLPTPTPRSPGERRSRPCRFNVSYSINTVAARTTRIAPANFMFRASSRRPTLPALCRDTGILVLYASLLQSTPSARSAGERRRRPLHMCSLTFQKNGSFAVTACRFAPDGKTLVSASWDATVKLWSVADGKCERTFTGHR